MVIFYSYVSLPEGIYIYTHIITLASIHYPMRHENQWSLLRGAHRARITDGMEDVVRFHLGTVFFWEVKIIYGTYRDWEIMGI